MTVIAWDGKTLAADKRGENAGMARTVTKVHRFACGAIGACSGDAHDARELIAWYDAGGQPDDFPKRQQGDKDTVTCMVVITTDREICHFNGSPHPLLIEDAFFAMGSGRDYATAAMHYGKTAREAVELASIYDLGCGNGVDTLTLEEA